MKSGSFVLCFKFTLLAFSCFAEKVHFCRRREKSEGVRRRGRSKHATTEDGSIFLARVSLDARERSSGRDQTARADGYFYGKGKE